MQEVQEVRVFLGLSYQIRCKGRVVRAKLFAPLRDKAVFDRFDLDGWTVCWLDGTIDIAPEHLYELGVGA